MAQFAVRRTISPPQAQGAQFKPPDWKTRGRLDPGALTGGLARPEYRLGRLIAGGSDHRSRALLVSYLVHVSAMYLMLQLPHLTGSKPGELRHKSFREYEFRILNLSQYSSALKAKGEEGKIRLKLANEGTPSASAARHPRLKFVSNPVRPNNRRQTIVQTVVAPNVVLPFDVSVPNILVGAVQQKPRLPSIMAPVKPSVVNRTVNEVPAPATHADIAIDLVDSKMISPQLLVAPAAPVASSFTAADSASPGTQSSAGAQGGILAVSVDPAPASTLVGLPLGNRYGAFSIGGATSGRNANGTGIDSGGQGGGGRGSGSGTHGQGQGGGADSEVTAAGLPGFDGSSSSGSGRILVGGIRPGEIFAVPLSSNHIRKNQMMVSAGPAGGGGLPIYGVLQGGRIYTVYISMPGRSWVMQYCHRSAGPATPSQNSAVVVTMEQRVLAPEPIEKFDFQRPAIPAEKSGLLIILRGRLIEDGSINQLDVLQGVTPDLDKYALAAVRKWRFHPAMYQRKSVAVDFLLGIPASTGPVL